MKEILCRNRQFVLYCVIGASGATLDFLVYSAFVKSAFLQYQAANAVSYACGTLLSFFLNAHFNFKVRDRLAARMFSFFCIAFMGWAASAGTLYWLINQESMNKYVSKVAALGIVVLLQYNLNRLISFRKTIPAKS